MHRTTASGPLHGERPAGRRELAAAEALRRPAEEGRELTVAEALRRPAAEGQELAAALAMPASRGRAVDAPVAGEA